MNAPGTHHRTSDYLARRTAVTFDLCPRGDDGAPEAARGAAADDEVALDCNRVGVECNCRDAEWLLTERLNADEWFERREESEAFPRFGWWRRR